MARVNRVAKTAIEVDANVERAVKAVQRLQGEIKKQSGEVKRATKQMNRYNTSLRRAGQAGSVFKRSLQFLALGTFALQLRAAVTESLALDKALVTVAKTTDLSNPGLVQLSSNLQNLSHELGIGTTKLAEITGLTGQLGVRGTQELSAFTEVIGQLTTATNLSGDAATTSLARVLKLTGSDIISNIDGLGSSVAALGDAFVTTETAIADFMETLAPVLRLQGFKPQDIAGAATAASSVGLDPAMTRTSMYRLGAKLDTLQKAPIDDPILGLYADTMQLTPEKAQKLLREDRPTAMLGFYSQLGGVSNSREILEKMGFTDLRTHVVAQALATPQTLQALEYGREQFDLATRLPSETERALASPSGRWGRSSTRIDNYRRSVGDVMRDVLLPGYEKVGETLGEWATPSGRARITMGQGNPNPEEQALAFELLASTKPGTLALGQKMAGLIYSRSRSSYPDMSNEGMLSLQASKEAELASLREEEKKAQGLASLLAAEGPENDFFVGSQINKITKLEEELKDIRHRLGIDKGLKESRSRAQMLLSSTPPGAVGKTGSSSAPLREVHIPGDEDSVDELVKPTVPRELRNRTFLQHYELFQEDLNNASSRSDFMDYNYLSAGGKREYDRKMAEMADEKIRIENRRRDFRRQNYVARTSPGVEEGRLQDMTASRAPNYYEEFAAQARGDDIAAKNLRREEDKALKEAQLIEDYEFILKKEKELYEARVRYYEDMKEGWVSIGDTFAQSIGGMIAGVTDLREAFGNMIRHLQKEVMQQMIVGPIANYTRGIVGGWADNIYGTPQARASGGGIEGMIDKAAHLGKDKGLLGTLKAIASGEFLETLNPTSQFSNIGSGEGSGGFRQRKDIPATGGWVQTKDTPFWMKALDFVSKAYGAGQQFSGAPGPPPPNPNPLGHGAAGGPVPGRAALGGNVRSEGLAMVGEYGPELVKMPKGARIEPLLGGESMHKPTTINMNIPVQDPTVVRREIEAMLPRISQVVQNDVVVNSVGNSEVAQTFSR